MGASKLFATVTITSEINPRIKEKKTKKREEECTGEEDPPYIVEEESAEEDGSDLCETTPLIIMIQFIMREEKRRLPGMSQC